MATIFREFMKINFKDSNNDNVTLLIEEVAAVKQMGKYAEIVLKSGKQYIVDATVGCKISERMK
jgi:hypothetical protein